MNDRLPPALSQAVHSLATSAPPTPADLEVVRRRARTHRRRRVGLPAALAVVVVAALGAAVALIPAGRRDEPHPATPASPPKRLILNADLVQSMGDADFEQPSRVFPESIVELLPDGTVKLLPKPPGLLPPFSVTPTPDGRLVVLGYASREPEMQRLVLLGRDLTVLGQHDLPARRRPSPGTSLLGASNTEVFLSGADGGALDLTTWRAGQPLPSGPWTTYVDSIASTPVVSQFDDADGCRLTVLDSHSKQPVRVVGVPANICGHRFGMALSPDGTRLAAIVRDRTDSPVTPESIQSGWAVQVLDMATGRMLVSYPVDPFEGPPSPSDDSRVFWPYRTLGWADANTIVLAFGTVPAGELIRLATALHIERFAVR